MLGLPPAKVESVWSGFDPSEIKLDKMFPPRQIQILPSCKKELPPNDVQVRDRPLNALRPILRKCQDSQICTEVQAKNYTEIRPEVSIKFVPIPFPSEFEYFGKISVEYIFILEYIFFRFSFNNNAGPIPRRPMRWAASRNALRPIRPSAGIPAARARQPGLGAGAGRGTPRPGPRCGPMNDPSPPLQG